MPAEGIELSPPENILQREEIFKLSSLFVRLGVKKIRLTGGEPTTRKDLIEIIQDLNSLKKNGLQQISMTTNGLALKSKLGKLKDAGLDNLNISLDTLNAQKFELITRRRGFDNVLSTIKEASDIFQPVKVNCVVMKDLNDSEIFDFIRLTENHLLSVRFIEYMPFDGNKWENEKLVPSRELLSAVKQVYEFETIGSDIHDTTKYYKVSGFKGNFGFISSMTDHFCSGCNRLRITANGHLKVCLFGNEEVNLLAYMRKNPDKEEELVDMIRNALYAKKFKHAGLDNLPYIKNRPMILIGG